MNKRTWMCLGLAVLVLAIITFWLTTSRRAKGPTGPVKADRTAEDLPRAALDRVYGKELPAATQDHEPVKALHFAPRDGETVQIRFDMTAAARIDFTVLLGQALTQGLLNVKPGLQPVRMEASGRLCLKYYADGPALWNVAAQIEDPVYTLNGQDPAFAWALRNPIAFRMNNLGVMSDLVFANGTPGGARSVLKEIVLSMQVVLPEAPQRQWQTEEADANGDYVASYRVREEGGTGPFELEKRKLRYLTTQIPEGVPAAAADKLRTLVEDSETEIAVAEKGCWFLSQEQEQSLRQEKEDTVVSENWTQLHAVQEGGTGRTRFPETFSAFQAQLASSRYLMQHLYVTDPQWDEISRGLDMNGALSEYDRLSSLGNSDAGRRADAFLVNFLRAYPDQAAALILALAEDPDYARYSEKAHLHLWFLITEAGHPKAQQAVVDAARNPEYGDATRIRAMMYVSSFAFPDKALVDTLWAMSRGGVESEVPETARELQGMSLLAIGVLGSSEKGNEAVKPLVAEKLREGLRSASDPWDQRMTLMAIGNYGADDMLDTVAPYLRSPDEAVRADACAALRKMQDPRAQELLIESYGREESRGVQAKAVQTLASMDASRETEQWAGTEVLQTQDAGLQASLVTLLGRHLKAYPANERILRDLLTADPPREVKKAIYSYIPPE